MYSEIGSAFWDCSLDSTIKNRFFWNNPEYNVYYFKSGRNAIKALCQNLRFSKKSVILPIYTCDTIIRPFIDEKWNVSFYRINRNLTIDEDDLIKQINTIQPNVVFVHSYFGFDTLRNLPVLETIKERNIFIVEDLTQSLFSEHHLNFADYYVTSFRKFLAVPDGGALVSHRKLASLKIRESDSEIEKVALDAFELKRRYFQDQREKTKEVFLRKYQRLNALIGDNAVLSEITPASIHIISSCDIARIRAARRKNYNYVYRKLESVPNIQLILGISEEGQCPLYLPIYVDNRKEFQSFLIDKKIYCPVIWPKSDNITVLDAEAEYMYNHMICLPIDQRYSTEEMAFVVNTIISFFDNSEGESNG